MKKCNSCKLEFDMSNFFKDKGFKDGLRSTCKACDKAKFAKWRLINKEKHNEVSKQWHNNHKELRVKRARAWDNAHPERVKELRRQYKKHLKIATPKWVDLEPIRALYRNKPTGFHVDHIIPLNGKNVSGLHVIWNLQYLPASQNLLKSNKVNYAN